MIHGAVAPARFDLQNEDLVRAHVHSVVARRRPVSTSSPRCRTSSISNGLEMPVLPEIEARLG